MKRITKFGLVVTAMSFAAVSLVQSAVTDTETFNLTVASVLSIAKPTALVTLAHNETDANQVFAVQSWSVLQNPIHGTTATFTATPFTHTTDNTYKSNAKMTLSLLAGTEALANWTLPGTAFATTDHTSGTPNATVATSSTKAGNANVGVAVEFVNADYSTLASGTYSATVTGTVAANP